MRPLDNLLMTTSMPTEETSRKRRNLEKLKVLRVSRSQIKVETQTLLETRLLIETLMLHTTSLLVKVLT